MTINQLLQKLEPTSPILQANFGIERESLRVDRQGKLAHTPHPSCLGARSFHPYIQTDFCEFQMELITPVAKSTTEARRFLGAITDVAGRSISKDELLWPLSMPPRIKAQEIQVAQLENEFDAIIGTTWLKNMELNYKLSQVSTITWNLVKIWLMPYSKKATRLI